MESIYLPIILIAIASMSAQWIGWKLKIPAIVFLLIFGLIVGPFTGLIQPRAFLGDLFTPLTSLAVAIILFEGALNLNFKELRRIGKMATQLIFLGGLIRWGLISASAHYIAGLSWAVSLTFGAILVVTGPTVIIPLLKQARLGNKISNLLKWEGIVNDPIGAILAVLVFEFFAFQTNTNLPITNFIGEMGLIIVAVSLVSYALGLVIAEIIERGWLPEYLISPFLFSAVIVLYIFSDFMLHEAGLIAVTVLGMTLANKDIAALEEIKRFKENLTILLVSGVFILLTADLEMSMITDISIGGVLFILSVIFVIRPISAMLTSIGTGWKKEEILMIGWIAPRGIVCAAVAALMAHLLVDLGYEDAQHILPLAFYIVVVTVILHGLSVKPLARALKLGASEVGGLLIVGSSNWASNLAAVLQKLGIPVMIASTNWRKLSDARLNNIPVYYGEIMSEDTDFNVELSHYEHLLAATDNPAYNALACSRFVGEFNRENVFQLALSEEEYPERKRIQKSFKGKSFLNGTYDYFFLWKLYREGWRFSATHITDKYSFKDFMIDNTGDKEPIIAAIVKGGKHLRLLADSKALDNIKEDDVIIAFTKLSDTEIAAESDT